MAFKHLHILIVSVLIVACSTSKKVTDTNESQSEVTPIEEIKEEVDEEVILDDPVKEERKETIRDAKVLPGTAEVSGCQVIATVISIDKSLDTAHPELPCGQVPCSALIRIDQVVKMGQQCAPFIIAGLELKAFFRFTLSKTDTLFPDMKRHFPGLAKNDTFAATFVAFPDKNDEYQAVINAYAKSE